MLVATAAAVPLPLSPAVRPAADIPPSSRCAGPPAREWPTADVDRHHRSVRHAAVSDCPGRCTFTSVAVRTRGESWPLTGILRLLGLAVGGPARLADPVAGRGRMCRCGNSPGLFDLTADQSSAEPGPPHWSRRSPRNPRRPSGDLRAAPRVWRSANAVQRPARRAVLGRHSGPGYRLRPGAAMPGSAQRRPDVPVPGLLPPDPRLDVQRTCDRPTPRSTPSWSTGSTTVSPISRCIR